ncbi:hypothetical protein OR1_02438 [Geobacter sp. OR-1]|uniref:DUF948 domain-containing protein n=1 Tax=Geobacter sp. OR-1 TaxID=1266765 RepID=UPI000543A62E|nr:DUF948 domain-containing protein [Geobacter sp. OR-1]GAM10150.1 hypothetical protein OR1_02438 [Geobacter sp. OR-1]
MVIVSIAVLIMAVTLIVLAAAIVPAFLEIKKTAAASRETLERIEADLRPVLKELHETLTDLKEIVHETAEKRDEVATFMEALGDTGRGLRTINGVVGSVAGILSTSSLWVTGAKVAGKYAVEKFLRKRRKADGEQ